MKIPVKISGFSALLVVLLLCAPVVQARDTVHYLPIQDVIEMGKANGELGADVKLYFANQPHPAAETVLTKGVTTNKKTNAVNKSDEEACKWVMLSALIQMQQGARNQGGNAVVNIESFYKKKAYRSNDKYECHAGAIMSGVALRGDVVKLRH
ncbi:MAG: excinuclease ATPase subunit [Betaproteobacteria bacterium]|nr:excinuclease ATPase subunit [Betaproteobacteria bacterium]